MILTCPNCASRFMLSAQMLAPEGRRVRCSACREQWFQLPDPDELLENIERQMAEIPDSVKPIPKGSALPVLRKDKPEGLENPLSTMGAGFAGAGVVFVVVFALLIVMKPVMVRVWLPSAGLYQALGLSVEGYGEGLSFDQLAVAQEAGKGLRIQGRILNLSSLTQVLPMIEATVTDHKGQVKARWYIALPETSIAEEGVLPFQAAYQGDITDARTLALRFVLGAGE